MAFNPISSFREIAGHERLIQNLGQAIKNELFKEDVNSFFRIQPGIKGGQQVVALNPLEYVTRKDEGCGGEADRYSISGVEQKWNPRLAKVKIKICYTEMMDSFMRWGLANGYNIHDLSKADFFKFIKDQVVSAMKADLLRIVLFGDKDIASQNILTDSNKAKYYDLIDKGVIPTLQMLQANPLFENQIISFDYLGENGGSPKVLGLLKEVFKRQYFNSDQVLTSLSVFEAYADTLKFNGGNGIILESSKKEIQNGINSLNYNGHKLTPIRFYDKKRFEDFTKNGQTHLPHFILNTSKNNLVVGIDDQASLTNLTMEYIGGEDEHFYIKGNYSVDFKIPNPMALKGALGGEEENR